MIATKKNEFLVIGGRVYEYVLQPAGSFKRFTKENGVRTQLYKIKSFKIPWKAVFAGDKIILQRLKKSKIVKREILRQQPVGFLKKLGKGLKKIAKSGARTITRPVSAIIGKDVVGRKGTIFAKGFGRKLDKGLSAVTKVTGIITAGVVGSKLIGGAAKGGAGLRSGANPPTSTFFSKIAKSGFGQGLKSALTTGLKSTLTSGLTSGLQSLGVSSGDLDSGQSSFLGIGDKKRQEETNKMYLMIAGIALAGIGLLVAILKK